MFFLMMNNSINLKTVTNKFQLDSNYIISSLVRVGNHTKWSKVEDLVWIQTQVKKLPIIIN